MVGCTMIAPCTKKGTCGVGQHQIMMRMGDGDIVVKMVTACEKWLMQMSMIY